nr:ribonuclease H-like domain-containing protein [Tanacetum cinerariifolium]
MMLVVDFIHLHETVLHEIRGYLLLLVFSCMLVALGLSLNYITKGRLAGSARLEVANYDKMLKLMQFLMGLDDIYQPIRSSIPTRKVLLEAKDSFLIISREESHRGIPSSSGTVKTEKA